MYACMDVCMYACMYVCMYACMYVCICMYVCLTLSISAFHLSILSEVWLLNFLRWYTCLIFNIMLQPLSIYIYIWYMYIYIYTHTHMWVPPVPPVMWTLVSKSPSNCSYRYQKPVREIGVIHQLSYRKRWPHCIYIYITNNIQLDMSERTAVAAIDGHYS